MATPNLTSRLTIDNLHGLTVSELQDILALVPEKATITLVQEGETFTTTFTWTLEPNNPEDQEAVRRAKEADIPTQAMPIPARRAAIPLT